MYQKSFLSLINRSMYRCMQFSQYQRQFSSHYQSIKRNIIKKKAMPCRCYLRSLHFNIYQTSYKSYSHSISHPEKLTLSVNQKTHHSTTDAKSFYTVMKLILLLSPNLRDYNIPIAKSL